MSDSDPPDDEREAAEDDPAAEDAGDGPENAGDDHPDDGESVPVNEGVQPGDSVEADDADGEEGATAADASGFGFGEEVGAGDGAPPLSELVDRTREADDVDTEAVMDAFESVDVDAVDADALWEQLEMSRPDAGPTDGAVTDGASAPGDAGERHVETVAKRDYCMRCQYFAAPPEARCTYDGSEILELVGTDRFRVADCPIVGGEEELENLRR